MISSWETLLAFWLWGISSLLGHIQDKPYFHDVRLPDFHISNGSRTFFPHPEKIQTVPLKPETPGQMGSCPWERCVPRHRKESYLMAQKKAILLCSSTGTPHTKPNHSPVVENDTLNFRKRKMWKSEAGFKVNHLPPKAFLRHPKSEH